MHKQTFGCHCGVFSLAKSSNGILIPGSKSKPVYKSFFPYMEIDELAGHYVMRANSGDALICETLVHVLLIGHQSEPEPFLGIKPVGTDSEDLRGVFKPFIGKKVEFAFAPFKTQSSSDTQHKQTHTLKQTRTIKPEQCNTREAVKGQADIGANTGKSADYIVREYIDFVNQQVGVYNGCYCRFCWSPCSCREAGLSDYAEN